MRKKGPGSSNGGYSALAQILLAYKHALIHVGVFSGVIAILMLTPTLYMLQVYDRVLISGNETTLWMLTLIVLMMYLFIGALEWIRGLLVWRLSVGLDEKLAPRVFDAAFSANLKTGKLNAAQPLEDLQQLRQFITGQWLLALFDAPWSPIYILVMFYFHSVLGWFALGSTLILLALGWLNERVSRVHLKKAGEMMIASSRGADANLRNAEVIAGMGMLANLRRRWATQHQSYVHEQSLAYARMTKIQGCNKSLRLVMQSLALGLCAWLVLQHIMTPGMMIAGSVLLSRALSPIDQIVGASRHWTNVKEAHRRLSQLLGAFSHQNKGMAFPHPQGAVSVEKLLVAAPGRAQMLLQGINFKLTAGEALVIIGSSGAGKSTLARCLVNALQPLRGRICLDNASLDQWQPEVLGAQIGYLPQDVQLFAGSVAENIARFDNIEEQKVIAAAQMAGVHELILQLPEGYQTQLGDNGQGLSGGQRQRVGLARALYGKPCLMVLDEPNANLDETGDSMLVQAVSRMKQAGITLILITHKPNVIKQADKMLILNAGAQVDFGPPADVMARRQQVTKKAIR
ncbi:type I secretion system permease/ATPase [Citrobacter koseri]|uniref:type I secretion system permease/ATPase n=1 Tax=Citrobacter koseri TaxID=545 RepID=UPI0028BF177E|nr:type I secretion system permease/ATPase [Citrobacter koseri]MDT7487289.1 type I secretion system permease/ATPase [Citrobacter koseri]